MLLPSEFSVMVTGREAYDRISEEKWDLSICPRISP